MRGLALGAWLLAAVATGHAAQVHIPTPTGSAGALGTLRAHLRLVDAAGAPVMAFNGTGLATEYTNLVFGTDGVTVTLAPQAALSLPSGDPTYYQLTTSWAGGSSKWLFQVADVGTVQELRDLVGSTAIDGEGLFVELMAAVHDSAAAASADAAATAVDRAAIEAIHTVHTLVWYGDTALVEAGNITLYATSPGQLAGLVCRVITAPSGGAINFDLLAGAPLVSAYGSGAKPTILAGDTTTLTGHPEAVPNPITLAAGDPIRVSVLSAPDQNLDGTVGLVADLSPYAPAGQRIHVLADNHVWTRNAYDAVTWTDTGLPADGAWLGAVATSANLPTATASASDKWLTSDTASVWQMYLDIDGHAAAYASLPAASSVASGTVYATTAEARVWVSDGVSVWSDTGAAWTDTGSVWHSTIAFTTLATAAELPTAANEGVYYLALDTGHLWRNDAPLWLDSGLLTIFAGAGLRCLVYIYPLTGS